MVLRTVKRLCHYHIRCEPASKDRRDWAIREQSHAAGYDMLVTDRSHVPNVGETVHIDGQPETVKWIVTKVLRAHKPNAFKLNWTSNASADVYRSIDDYREVA